MVRLLLGVMGHINFLKIILLHKLLYIVWQAPLYILPCFLKSMGSLLNTFIYFCHKLSWHTLKSPMNLGGTVLPVFNLHYIDSQLYNFFYLDKGERDRYITLLCPSIPHPLIHPFQIFLSGSHNPIYLGDQGQILFHHCKIWNLAMSQTNASPFHAHTPFWSNLHLAELLSVPDHRLWVDREVIYV